MVLWLLGCTGSTVDEHFRPVWPMFPFDGVRTWTYVSTGPTVADELVATSSGKPEQVGRFRVYPVEYAVEGEVLRTVRWSSDSTRGVRIHGYDQTDFSPPIQLATADMTELHDPVVTETAGATWTSTMLAVEDCPVQLDAGWPECGRFELTGPDPVVAGTYWATVGNGTAAFALEGESGQWQLADLTCDGECDGRW